MDAPRRLHPGLREVLGRELSGEAYSETYEFNGPGAHAGRPLPDPSDDSVEQGRVLRIARVSKTFTGQKALDDVELEVRSGEVLALCGENGSGKSTLIKILAGYHTPDPGSSSSLDGADIDLTENARTHGGWRQRLHFIHQDLALVDGLNAVENLALGRGYETALGSRIRWREERRRAKALFDEFDASFDLDAPVGSLRTADRVLVAIVRALQNWDPSVWNVLFLDEPTASLPSHEVAVLFRAIRTVAARGAGVVFVSHRLAEVFALATRATVLRNGRLVGSRDVAALDHDGLVEMIVGRSLAPRDVAGLDGSRDILLEVRGLSGEIVRHADFVLREGELLGIAGLTGSGREELPMILSGAQRRRGGSAVLGGTPINLRSIGTALRSRIALVPAERAHLGAIPAQTVRENLTLPLLSPLFRRGRLGLGRERREARGWLREMDVRPLDPEIALANLSGGNQQKVVLAKWLRTEPRLLILDQPTQGVDVGSRAQIYDLLTKTARGGVGVIVCSSEAAELEVLCDRVLVFRDGHIAAELVGGAVTEDLIVRESLGSSRSLVQADTAQSDHATAEVG